MRSAVVTGAGGGIGRAIGERLRSDGWYVVGIEIDAGSAADLSSALGSSGRAVNGDAGNRDVLETAAELATQAGQLGCWVNNAAYSATQVFHEAVPAEVERIIGLNLMGTYWGSAQAVRRYLAHGQGGSIVNISSVHARMGFAGWSAYDASKGAVEALTRSLAVEYGPAGIRVNAVAPGTISDTPAHRKAHVPGAVGALAAERMERMQPLGRSGASAEIASAVSFLVSNAAAFITGQVLVIDGGLTAGMPAQEQR